MTKQPSPLDGTLILDFTRVLAGPYCTMTLSDLGAEIIKVENPKGGDDTRHFTPPDFGGVSTYFLAINRNKKSIALDVSSAEGQAVARDLAARADVVIENFSASVMSRWGLDYASLAAANPGVVYCSISGYGRDGALANRAGYDPVIQAESGMMAVNGDPDCDPVRLGVSLIDIFAGMFAAQAILAALVHRKDSGVGQCIDVPLFDTSAAVLVPYATSYLAAGVDTTRFGNSSPIAQPVGLFEAADGPFILTAANDALFGKLCAVVLKEPELAQDPKFVTNEGRVLNKPLLTETLNGLFARDTRDNWIEALRAAGVPAGAIRTVAEAFNSDEAKARGIVREAPHATAGAVPTVASPMNFSHTPVRDPVAAPLLGQHTEEILRDVAGYDDDRIAALNSSGVVVTAPDVP